MGKKSSFDLTLCLLLMVALCFEAVIIDHILYYRHDEKTWTKAGLHCENRHVDVFLQNRRTSYCWFTQVMENWTQKVWINLFRDPETMSACEWITHRSRRGVSEDNVSESTTWADKQQMYHCGVMLNADVEWYSEPCPSRNNFNHLSGDTVKFHNISFSWYNASLRCHAHQLSDLTPISTSSTLQERMGWTGLHQLNSTNWSWIRNISFIDRNWTRAESNISNWASFNTTPKKCQSKACSIKLHLVCYDDNLVVVNENKTWEDALRHCLEMKAMCVNASNSCNYSYNLLSLDHSSDYNYVRDRIERATTDEVWIGLRFLGGSWWWLNGHKVKDQGMLPSCPSQWKHCGVLSKNDTNNWIIKDCSERRPFICYRYKEEAQTLTVS